MKEAYKMMSAVDALKEAWNQGPILDISRLSKNVIGSNEAYATLAGNCGENVCHFKSQRALYCIM
jgi:hypothetical protein